MEVTRERAWETLTEYTKSEALLRHALAVEASYGAYARQFGEDEELWRATALLHDFDYEIHPTLDKHPQDGAPILREEGYPEELIEAVLSHAEHLAMPRDTPLKKTLFACDELSGFVHACGLVRPTGIDGLEPKSVRKKLKQPSFAAGVHRDEVYAGAELLGRRARRAHRVRDRGDAADRARARAAHGRRTRVSAPRFEALGVVVSDMERSLAFYRMLGLEFPDGSESEGHVEAPLPGGLRFMFDAEATIRSFEPDWERPKGTAVGLAFACDLRGGRRPCLRRADGRRARRPQGALGRVLGPALRAGQRPGRQRDRPLRAALESLDQAVEVLVARPAAARRADPARCRAARARSRRARRAA